MGLGGSFASAQEEAELEQCHIDRDTLLVMLESLAQVLTALGFEMASFVFGWRFRGSPPSIATSGLCWSSGVDALARIWPRIPRV